MARVTGYRSAHSNGDGARSPQAGKRPVAIPGSPGPAVSWLARAAVCCLVLLALAGCASTVPQAIRAMPADQPTVVAARAAPEALRGSAVRWGGELIRIRNLPEHSELEILARRLDGDGEPDPDSPGEGRFIARVPGFIDPADYAPGDRVTVAGVLDGSSEDKVGDYPYIFPIVAAREHYRWPDPVPAASYYRYPHYYAPWPYYYPWRPYHFYPFGWPHPWW